MSTPPNERPPADEQPEQDEPPTDRRHSGPLVWLLLLIALAAIAWYVVNQRDTVDAPPEAATPVEQPLDEEDDAAADTGSPAPTPEPAAPDPPVAVPADRPAEPLTRVQPAYPAAALRSREQGTVLLRVDVDAQGRPASVNVENSSRSRELDRAARDAVEQWTFSPAIEDGQPVPSTVTVPVDFMVEP